MTTQPNPVSAADLVARPSQSALNLLRAVHPEYRKTVLMVAREIRNRRSVRSDYVTAEDVTWAKAQTGRFGGAL